MIDTLGRDNAEGKEDSALGVAPAAFADDEKFDDKSDRSGTCKWKGKFKELITSHLEQCAKKNDPSFLLKVRIRN